ncbi:maleylpyruvate isomerase family mycothiol-dependent enzyme [Streptomyces sp. MST-110588]|uniref:maleylpyruvate isomerase family mycothiol-dependent enzyme n=1 Tax=Streptomyces sp. MST-110588 TaxID=2833628 RepID=UPI001F5D3970|nr:maleylpyruvate isomerase family mycothiol-dependent enzyme [Streptomyces sp. MST-110588]UNO44010.1 maleylpyruvate isomerase family mycothiol-dependent enzyme [Streptomyces sp. MST-110588]
MPPASRKPRARSYDPARTRAAVTAQLAHVLDAVHALDPGQLKLPTRLGDWTVGDLVAHFSMAVAHVSRTLEQPAAPAQDLTLVQWPFAAAPLAEQVDQTVRSMAAAADPVDLLDRAAAQYAEVVPAAPDDRIVATRVGAMRLDDLLVTRCLELVVHSDDLAAATGQEIPYDRQALAATVRLLADALAVKAPGGSVEVRIPPFAVVQCVAGPKHTRGTPPNVVETDPLTWIRLATGRTTWAEARESAAVGASGERADLGPYLPVLS